MLAHKSTPIRYKHSIGLIFTFIGWAGLVLAEECNFADPNLYSENNFDKLTSCLSNERLSVNNVQHVVKYADAWTIDDVLRFTDDKIYETLIERDSDGEPLSIYAVTNDQPEALISVAWYGFDLAETSDEVDNGWLKRKTGTTPLHNAFKFGKIDHAAFLLALHGFNDISDSAGKDAEDYATGIGKELYNNALGISASRFEKQYFQSTQKTNCDLFLTDAFFKSASLPDINSCLINGAIIGGTNSQGDTAFHLAARNSKDVDIFWLLATALGDFEEIVDALNWRNLSGNTPLHEASAHSQDPNIVTRLLYMGSALLAQNNKGQTSIHLAAKRQDQESDLIMARLLASNEATGLINIRVPLDNSGNSPLHYAAQNDSLGITTRLLLLFGYSPDDRNISGITPLMIAAEDKVDRSAESEAEDLLKFSDGDQIISFLDMLDYSNDACKPVPDKFSDNAGITVFEIAKKNPSLTNADNSGKEIPAIQVLIDLCTE